MTFIFVVAEFFVGSYVVDLEAIGGKNPLYNFFYNTKEGDSATDGSYNTYLDSFLYELGNPTFRLKIQNFTQILFDEIHQKTFQKMTITSAINGKIVSKENKNSATKTSTSGTKVNNDNTEQMIKTLQYLGELGKRQHYNQVDLFVKQLSRARRFERSPKTGTAIDELLNWFSGVDYDRKYGSTKSLESQTLENIDTHNTTIIFNTLNEITDVGALIENLGENIDAEWAQTTKLLVAITPDNAKLFTSKLQKLKEMLPAFSWLVIPNSMNNNLLATLVYVAVRTSTRYLLFTRRIRKMDPKLDLSSFLRPLLKRTADIIAGTVVLSNGQWESGCYQTKLIWSQLTVHSGYDNHRTKGLVQCDATDSPFAISRSSVLSILLSLENRKKYPKLGNFPTGYPIYLQFFHVARLSHDFVVKTHLPTLFHIDDEIDKEKVKLKENALPSREVLLHRMTRAQWKDFANRNDISDIWTPTTSDPLYDSGVHHFEFTWQEANIRNCLSSPKSNMMKPRACIRNLHKLLLGSYKLFDRFGYQYSTEDGSGLGATKLHDTLPWELDHDFSFRTQNITDMLQHKSDFEKIGIYLVPEINKPCINSTQEQSSWRCGYVALRGRFWRLEAWCQRILPGDVYRPDTILPVYKDLYPRTRLVGEKFTSIRIGDFWSQTVVNPGYYVRARYGLDCLRHAQHWAVTGLSTSWGQYSTTSTHFEPCPDEGHHLCLNQYLADGNIQFQQPWA